MASPGRDALKVSVCLVQIPDWPTFSQSTELILRDIAPRFPGGSATMRRCCQSKFSAKAMMAHGFSSTRGVFS